MYAPRRLQTRRDLPSRGALAAIQGLFAEYVRTRDPAVLLVLADAFEEQGYVRLARDIAYAARWGVDVSRGMTKQQLAAWGLEASQVRHFESLESRVWSALEHLSRGIRREPLSPVLWTFESVREPGPVTAYPRFIVVWFPVRLMFEYEEKPRMRHGDLVEALTQVRSPPLPPIARGTVFRDNPLSTAPDLGTFDLHRITARRFLGSSATDETSLRLHGAPR